MKLKFLTMHEVSRKVNLPFKKIGSLIDGKHFPRYLLVKDTALFVEHEIEYWMLEQIEERDD